MSGVNSGLDKCAELLGNILEIKSARAKGSEQSLDLAFYSVLIQVQIVKYVVQFMKLHPIHVEIKKSASHCADKPLYQRTTFLRNKKTKPALACSKFASTKLKPNKAIHIPTAKIQGMIFYKQHVLGVTAIAACYSSFNFIA